MPTHAPPGYACPFCLLAQARFDDPRLRSRPEDVILRTPTVLAVVSSHTWPSNPGNVLILPADHHENLYDLPQPLGAEIFNVTQALARAMKRAYACPGTSTRQHNEPAGNQDVWHYTPAPLPPLPQRPPLRTKTPPNPRPPQRPRPLRHPPPISPDPRDQPPQLLGRLPDICTTTSAMRLTLIPI